MLAYISQKIVIFHVQWATLVKEIEDTLIKSVKKVDDLCIVCECQFGNDAFKALLLKCVFLVNEDLFKINLMDLFVGVVDAELFKTIMFKHLEAIDIQKLHLPYFFFSCAVDIQSSIELFYEPLKKTFIDGFCHWVSSFAALSLSQCTEHQFSCNCSSIGYKSFIELFSLNSKQKCDAFCNLRISYLAWLILAMCCWVKS